MHRKSEYANKKSLSVTVRHGLKAFGCLLALLTVWLAFDRKDTASMDLTPFEWKNRLLIIFAPDSHHPYFKQIQAEISTRTAGVADRDLAIFEVLARDASQMNGSPLSLSDADALRERFEIPRNTHALILVGKDGGVKLKRSEPVSLAEVFELIDSMPMRRNEMRQKKK
jgi:hypothetical protein